MLASQITLRCIPPHLPRLWITRSKNTVPKVSIIHSEKWVTETFESARDFFGRYTTKRHYSPSSVISFYSSRHTFPALISLAVREIISTSEEKSYYSYILTSLSFYEKLLRSISIEINELFAGFLASVSKRRASQRRIYTFLMCIYSVVLHGYLACSAVQHDQPLARISMTRIPRAMRGYALPFY